jgi:hypothetical protein
MATLNQILAEQLKLIGGAKAALEAAYKKPPTEAASIASKEVLVKDLKARITSLTEAKAAIAAQLDHQIAAYRAEIAGWEKQIEEDKKRVGEQPAAPGPTRRKGSGK